ncbi:MAG: hypothetical protein AB1Z98_28420 [Nannocystaceae bacterium]
MTNDTSNDAPGPGALGATPGTTFIREWAELGQRIERVAARTESGSLRELTRNAERLIIVLVWRSLGDNVSHVAGLLQVTRKRIRQGLVDVRPLKRAPLVGTTGPQEPTDEPSPRDDRPS